MNTPTMNKARQDLGKRLGQSGLGEGLNSIIAGQSSASASTQLPSQTVDSLIHLLGRTSFGVTQDMIMQADVIGESAWLDQQLNPESIDDSDIEELLATAFPSLQMSYAEILGQTEDPEFNPAIDLVISAILRQIFSPKQLFEVMTEFWTNHFNVFLFDGPVEYLKTVDDRENIRPLALGRFSELLHRNARSPAMLYYLDNYSNTVQGPNENYARELMELHTLGVNGGYNEQDVAEVARCFTGWSIDTRTEDLFGFFDITHDTDSKVVLGQGIPAGQGIEDGEQVLDLLAEHPSTASFLASKLCRRFISDTPDQGIIDMIAGRFSETDGDTRLVLETLLTSDAFRSAQGVKFKRPSEYVASVVRSTSAALDNEGRYLRLLFDQLQILGQLPFFSNPPTGYPDQETSWLSSGALLSRWNYALGISYGELPLPSSRNFDNNQNQLLYSDGINVPVLDLIGEARTPAAITDRLIDRILHRPISFDDRKALITHVADGAPNSVPLELEQAVKRGRAAVAAILSSRYFQFR